MIKRIEGQLHEVGGEALLDQREIAGIIDGDADACRPSAGADLVQRIDQMLPPRLLQIARIVEEEPIDLRSSKPIERLGRGVQHGARMGRLNRTRSDGRQLGDDPQTMSSGQMTTDQDFRIAIARCGIQISDPGLDRARENGGNLGFGWLSVPVRDAIVGTELDRAQPNAGQKVHALVTDSSTPAMTRSTSSSVRPGWKGSDRQPR